VRIVSVRDHCSRYGLPVYEIQKPRQFFLVENGLNEVGSPHSYGLADTFIAQVEYSQVVGSGSLVLGDDVMVHGLTSGNYRANISLQWKKYIHGGEIIFPKGMLYEKESVLLWGGDNFGHWLFTYLHRLTSLWHYPELKTLPLVVLESTPRRFQEWIIKMGFNHNQLVLVPDGTRFAKLWVPSVVQYRGHYEDSGAYISPSALHIFRHAVLGNGALVPRRPRTRIYLGRSGAKWRQLVNEPELIKLLAGADITHIQPEKMTVDEQLDVISRAELIVVAAGGASPTTMLAPADCAIIEITNKAFVGTFASRCWAHILGQRFHRMEVDIVENSARNEDGKTGEHITAGLSGNLEIDKDGRVPLGEVQRCLETLSA
jgi:capsular polysaccharide biosynthesis protein